MQVFFKFLCAVPGSSCRGGGTRPSVAFLISRSELFHTQKEELGSALPGWGRKSQFPFWDGRNWGTLVCRAAAQGGKGWRGQEDKELQGSRGKRRGIFHAGALGEMAGIGWEEQAGSLTALLWAGQNQQTKTGLNDRPEVSQIEKGCMSALKSLNNFLAHGWQNFRGYDRGKVL